MERQSEFVSRGFKGRAREMNVALKGRIPPGQYETKDFRVLSAGPTPAHTARAVELFDLRIKTERYGPTGELTTDERG